MDLTIKRYRFAYQVKHYPPNRWLFIQPIQSLLFSFREGVRQWQIHVVLTLYCVNYTMGNVKGFARVQWGFGALHFKGIIFFQWIVCKTNGKQISVILNFALSFYFHRFYRNGVPVWNLFMPFSRAINLSPDQSRYTPTVLYHQHRWASSSSYSPDKIKVGLEKKKFHHLNCER